MLTKAQQDFANIYKAHWYAGIVAKCVIRQVVVESIILSTADTYSKNKRFNREAFLDACFGNHRPEGV